MGKKSMNLVPNKVGNRAIQQSGGKRSPHHLGRNQAATDKAGQISNNQGTKPVNNNRDNEIGTYSQKTVTEMTGILLPETEKEM